MKSIWEYQTFDHEHIAEVGGVFGGTRTFQDILATTNMTDSKTRVDLRIDFSVTSTPTLPASVQYLCTPLTLLYNSSKKFYAPNSFIIVN